MFHVVTMALASFQLYFARAVLLSCELLRSSVRQQIRSKYTNGTILKSYRQGVQRSIYYTRYAWYWLSCITCVIYRALDILVIGIPRKWVTTSQTVVVYGGEVWSVWRGVVVYGGEVWSVWRGVVVWMNEMDQWEYTLVWYPFTRRTTSDPADRPYRSITVLLTTKETGFRAQV